MDTLHFIAQRFDIQKLKSCCNEKGCKKVPTKELLLLEFNQRMPARKVASIYFCEKHCLEESKTIPEELKKSGGEKRVGGRIFSINRQVTA